jgi:V/A-type H+-transporting ATPase subunit E
MANLAALLDKEASAEIEAILSEARSRASEIVAEANEEAKAIKAQRERAAQLQYEAALVRAKSAAQLEASSLKLRAQHEVVEAVFTRARDEIAKLTKDQARYAKVLVALIEEAAEGLPADGELEVLVHPDEIASAKKALESVKLNATVREDASVATGVRLRVKGSSTTLENTLLGRLEALRGELASEVARTLQRTE